jgi:uncharacterized membrane protein YidH (DUF202 family)
MQSRNDENAAMTVYGAAAERTELAWQRTGLGVVVGCFLVFHTAFALGVIPIGVIAVGLGLLVAWLSVFVVPSSRFSRGEPADSWVLLTTVALAVAGLGALGTTMAIIVLWS